MDIKSNRSHEIFYAESFAMCTVDMKKYCHGDGNCDADKQQKSSKLQQ